MQHPSSPVSDGRARRPVSAEPPPPFPGASRHVHLPHACSTPCKNNDPQPPRHVRSVTEPTAVGELRVRSEAVGKDGPEKQQEDVKVDPLQSVGIDERLRRKEIQTKRKLKTERTRHKRSRSADAKKNHDPNYCRSAFTNEPVSEKNALSNLHNYGLNVQGYCSSVPNFCPYHHCHHHHPCYAFGSQYPTLSLPPPPPSLVCPHCALAQQQQSLHVQQMVPQWPKGARVGGGGEREKGSSQRCNSAPGVRMGPRDSCTEQPLSSAATAKAGTTGVLGDGPSSSGVQSIQLLAEEMQNTLQHSIDAIKKTTGISKCTVWEI